MFKDRHTKEAFLTICSEAKSIEGTYVSLYVKVPFYGGPEEGGWWGSDIELIAYEQCFSKEVAEVLIQTIKNLVEELNKDAKSAWGEQCQRENEWLEVRGLGADYFPECDGREEYFVALESVLGSSVSQGERQYS